MTQIHYMVKLVPSRATVLFEKTEFPARVQYVSFISISGADVQIGFGKTHNLPLTVSSGQSVSFNAQAGTVINLDENITAASTTSGSILGISAVA